MSTQTEHARRLPATSSGRRSPQYPQYPQNDRHPSWCCRDWCEVSADGAYHTSAVTVWRTREVAFECAVTAPPPAEGPATRVEATAQSTTRPGYIHFTFTPAELRLTIEHLSTLLGVAERGMT